MIRDLENIPIIKKMIEIEAPDFTQEEAKHYGFKPTYKLILSKELYNKVWAARNKEHIREYSKKWAEENKEYRREYNKKWAEENKEHIREYERKRRVVKG